MNLREAEEIISLNNLGKLADNTLNGWKVSKAEGVASATKAAEPLVEVLTEIKNLDPINRDFSHMQKIANEALATYRREHLGEDK